ncbi:hypothetical protein GWI33_019411 [Rhynchophorus ferrugineus]|uniref:Uncharacterized protein n=1 Tax=Rhynchophorus ferrugineus TaxID=354439 RepID=A0A834HTU6_RHYFE|nr:hypothetical protein GWI33_019411 [Rhynchophorus ferrugineus]
MTVLKSESDDDWSIAEGLGGQSNPISTHSGVGDFLLKRDRDGLGSLADDGLKEAAFERTLTGRRLDTTRSLARLQ